MDCAKVGGLIRRLRTEQGLTQRGLAERVFVSEQAVSKWERGMGCPDVSLLPEVAKQLGVDLEVLLRGELDANELVGGNMKKLKFYVCPDCGNLMTATAEATLTCCGKRLTALTAQKAADSDKLHAEIIENEYYISSEHEMTKAHSIAFVALLTGDTLFLRKLYPEWNLQTRIPCIGHGMLVWYCTQHGLFYQLL